MTVVSIIIPVYNAATTLKRCVDSVLSQRFTDFELFLIDDGSTDCSSEICDEYKLQDSRVKVVHKDNGGVSSARNEGLKRACGIWACFIDADDYIDPDFFPTQLGDNLSEGIDLYVHNWSCVGNSCSVLPDNFHSKQLSGEELSCFFRDNLWKLVFKAPWAKFFKLELITKHSLSFDTRFYFGEDCLFCLSYYRYVKKIEFIEQSSYRYFRDSSEFVNKYRIDIELALAFVEELWTKYCDLGFKCKQLLEMEVFDRFYRVRLTSRNWKIDYLKWISNPKVLAVKLEQCKYLGVKGKLKVVVIKLISPIIRFFLRRYRLGQTGRKDIQK